MWSGAPCRTRQSFVLPQQPPVRQQRECVVLPEGSRRSVIFGCSLLVVPSAHFVNDFYQFRRRRGGASGFSAFKNFHTGLGFKMKEPKEKKPARSHTLLGVLWTLVPEGVWARPGTRTRSEASSVPVRVLAKGTCSGPVAAKLAGKLTFVCSWVFGRAGQSLLKPLYRRQHSRSNTELELPPALRVSFSMLRELLPALKPRFLPSISRSMHMRIGRIYADAFITMHGERRCANRWLDTSSALQQLRQSTNGWGAIYFGPSGVKACFRAQVPVEVLQHCCTSRDYIYWLEAVAQLISIAAVARDQFDCLICFVDNTAAEHALNKGTSKNAALCWLLGSFWLWAAKRGPFRDFSASDQSG